MQYRIYLDPSRSSSLGVESEIMSANYGKVEELPISALRALKKSYMVLKEAESQELEGAKDQKISSLVSRLSHFLSSPNDEENFKQIILILDSVLNDGFIMNFFAYEIINELKKIDEFVVAYYEHKRVTIGWINEVFNHIVENAPKELIQVAIKKANKQFNIA